MKKLGFVLILLFVCCTAENREKTDIPYAVPSEYAVISHELAPEFWEAQIQYFFFSDSNSIKQLSFWTPKISDIGTAEKAILTQLKSELENNYIDDYYKEKLTYILEHFQNYQRQYLGLIVNSKKLIWCNYLLFQKDNNDLTMPIIVLDGGTGFWRFIYDDESKVCSHFEMNGEA